MSILSHFSYPALIFVVAAKASGTQYSLSDLFVLILFATLPDLIDSVWFVFSKKNYDNFKHHQYLTHWPITYLPCFIPLFLDVNLQSVLIALGIVSHFFMDLFFCGDGITLFTPFCRKYFRIYSRKTFGRHGHEWFGIYRSLLVWKLDIAAALLLVLVLIVKFT